MDDSVQSHPKLDPSLQKVITSMNDTREDSVTIIIQFTKLSHTLTSVLPLHPSDLIIYTYPQLPFVCAKLSLETICTLSTQPEIERLFLDRKVFAYNDIARKSIEADLIRQQHGLTGKGVTVAVLDTGIFLHPDFTQPLNRVKKFQDFINRLPHPYDDSGHGTHVAGCIAGNGSASQGKYTGLAPEADLVSIKVLNKDGVGTIGSVLAGIDYCLSHKDTLEIKIMNLSFGLAPHQNDYSDPLSLSVGIAVQAGITVCAAAENTSSPGKITIPACCPEVIGAGSVNDRGNSTINSNMASLFTTKPSIVSGKSKPDFFFPGFRIIGPLSPESILAKQLEPFVHSTDYMSLSGSSIATGFCSGTAALLLQAYPPLKPADVLQYMVKAKENSSDPLFKLSPLFNRNKE